MRPGLFVVLASHNGAEYLGDQIESLIRQSYTGWKLIARDDGSVDSSREILRRYARLDNRIELLLEDDGPASSAQRNFSVLLQHAYDRGADYVLCCDQDDVWESDKIRLLLRALQALEGETREPALVHHDLIVVNEELEVVSPSFFQSMGLQPSDESNPQRLITRNEVTGCAMACNRRLLEIALPIPEHAIMHDWWLALCAAYFGRLRAMPERLVKYRQHSANTIGAKSFWHGLNPFTNWIEGWHRGDQEFFDTVLQAKTFLHAMSDLIDEGSSEYQTLVQFSEILSASRAERIGSLRKFGLWRTHWFLNMLLVLRLLLLPRMPRS